MLTRLDTNPIPIGNDEIRLFATVRNERTRLPYLLTYYRNQGTDRFLFVDNNSSDGTREFLLQQPDCHVFHTANSYREAHFGIAWQNAVLNLYGTGHWCLVVDADELFVYPGCEKTSLRELCDYMDESGSEGLYTFLLDMYPDKDMAEAVCEPGVPFLDICPMHDKDYVFARRSFLDLMKLPNRPPPFPEQEVIGGPRARLFYPEQNTVKTWPRLKARLLSRILGLFARLGLLASEKVPHMEPMLFKIPLVKWHKDLVYFSSTHILTPIKLADITGALLHFKFFADFHEKAMTEAARGEHAGSGRQYRRYAEVLNATKDGRPFAYEGTVRYRDSRGLVTLGLMKSSPAYEHYLQSEQKKTKETG